MKQSLKTSLLATLLVIVSSPAFSAIVFSEISLSSDRIEIVNTGTDSIDISTHWWCNRVNGSPLYSRVSDSSTIDTAASTATGFNIGAGEVLVLTLTPNFLREDLGELGLYQTNNFGSSTAIVDYVLWGNSTGIRDTPAAAAGLWNTDESIDITGLGVDQTIQLSPSNLTGNQASDYSFGSANFGAVPEPSTALLAALSLSGLLRRKRK